jgi:hypothetical protein
MQSQRCISPRSGHGESHPKQIERQFLHRFSNPYLLADEETEAEKNSFAAADLNS